MPHIGAEDWSGWLRFADRLTEGGDGRGQLLRLAHRRVAAPRSTEERAAITAQIDQEMSLWLVMNGAQLGEQEGDAVEWYTRWRRDFNRVEAIAPPAVRAAMVWSEVQLLACASVHTRVASGVANGVVAAVMAWIEDAFDGVPPPGAANRTLRQAEAADSYQLHARTPGDSEGPWQRLSDAYLLENQSALAHLDAVGLRYYLPALMRFALRHLRAGHPDDLWITESLDYTLGHGTQARRGGRLAGLRVPERGAVAGFCWLTGNPSCADWTAGV